MASSGIPALRRMASPKSGSATRSIAIEGAGHSVQGDQPKALIEALHGFLGEIAWADGPAA